MPVSIQNKLIYTPSQSDISNANITAYMHWLLHNYKLSFSDYDQLWAWSVADISSFWESIIKYFDVKFHSPYTQVLEGEYMPNMRWFPGATLNYTEHVFRNKNNEHAAILYFSEMGESQEISWQQLEHEVIAFAHWLKTVGVQKGDRVAAYMPNIPEATVAFLATVAIGAVWSSASPDFGADSVIERFAQIEPKVLLAVSHYSYNGKIFDTTAAINQITEAIPSINHLVLLAENPKISKATLWQSIINASTNTYIPYEYVEFSEPIWVLYSSGTTGSPKAITHSQGGVLLEHLKYLSFHNDLKFGERYFWFSTTGWVMWNIVQSTLLLGATIVLYDGSPAYPSLSTLWQLIETAKIAHFGTSAPFILSCLKADFSPKATINFDSLRSIGNTGAPLPSDGFMWLNNHVKEQLWIESMSGGTDIATALVAGTPTLPVFAGEIQRPCLGVSVEAWDIAGQPITYQEGEMVVTKPIPSMPIYFWNDANRQKYTESYFEMYPNIWRHGDWLTITSQKSCIISGRSDATLNRNGIRIGTAEIYRVLEKIPLVQDSLIVNIEKKNGEHFMPLFVVLKEGNILNDSILNTINTTIRQTYSPRHVPDIVMQVPDIPYTMSGKKLEVPVKKILMGGHTNEVANKGSLRNPEAIEQFIKLRDDALRSYL